MRSAPHLARRRMEAATYAVAAVLTSLVTFLALELWSANLRVPLQYGGDALPVGAHFKTVIEEGWYEFQPRLGAPWGQQYHDFPTADNLHLIAAKILALFTDDWAVALNVYYLVGFPLAAIAAVWFLRTCGVSRVLAVAFSTLFAIAPYHFVRAENHLWLSSYYTVPLALGLLVLLLRRRPLFARGDSTNPVLAIIASPTSRTVVWVALLATSSTYYSVFFLALLAFTGVVVFVRDRKWGPFLAAVGTGVLTVAVMLLNMLPDILYTVAEGPNPGSLARDEAEADVYAFRIAQLLLPWSGHRIEPLRMLRERYDLAYLRGEPAEGPALGIVAGIGLLIAIVLVLVLAVSRSRAWNTARRLSLAASLSSLVVFAVLLATVGGFSTFISFLTSSLRGWNRMSIVIAMACLGIVALLLDHVLVRASGRRKWTPRLRNVVAAGLALIVLVVGFIDQTPADASSAYARNEARFAADQDYFSRVESRLPEGAMVLLLPYVPFPEGETAAGFIGSDQLVPYLHTDELRWTNGGIKGRPRADWPGQLDGYGDDALAALAVGSGSSAIVIQRAAYPDHGKAIEAALQETTGTLPFESTDGAYAMYDLGAVAGSISSAAGPESLDRIALRIVDPVVPYPTPDFRPIPGADGVVYRADRQGSGFTLVNDSEAPVDVRLTTRVDCGQCAGTLEITLGDRPLTEQSIEHAVELDEAVSIPPGTWRVSVAITDATGAAVADYTVSEPVIREVAVVEYLTCIEPRSCGG